MKLKAVARLRFLSDRVYKCPSQRRAVSRYCLLFPGQGSQYVGMGKGLIAAANSGVLPGVAQLFRLAEGVLGYDLCSLFLQGPEEKLEETVHCQPAVVVASLAGLEKIKHDSPEVGFRQPSGPCSGVG